MNLPLAYLTERTTIERAAADNDHEGKPFGRSNADWLRLLAEVRDGDELWQFAPPDRKAIQLWGLALIRGDQIVSTVVTAVD